MAIPQFRGKLIEAKLYPLKEAQSFLRDYPQIIEDHLMGNKE
jgi:hypothetical protein